ncbi:MAG: hypothetical protein IT350_16615 [Deltaproteobacteria bacterium]|nr:hypothetical protein [Deltaproteobacteria bacterium]
MTDETRERPMREAALCAVAVAVVIVVALVTYDAWNRRTQPIFAVRPHPMLPAAMQEFIRPGYGEYSAVVPRDKALLVWTSFALRHFGGDYVALMRAQLAVLALLIALAAVAAWPGGGAAAAIAAGAFVAFAPLTAELTLAFDDHLFNAAGVFVALALLAWSDGGRRRLVMLAAGLAAGAVLRGAFIPSNGLIALATVVFGALGLAAEHLVRERKSITHVVATRHADSMRDLIARPALGALAMPAGFALVAASIWASGRIQPGYYAGEWSRAFLPDELIPHTPGAVWAYPWLVFHEQLGPVGTAFVLTGLAAVVAFRPRGMGLWIGASLVPFALVVAIAKKNPYYDVYAVLAMLGLGGLGLAAIPRRAVRAVLIIVFVLAGAAFTGHRLFTGRTIEGTPLVMYHFQEQPGFWLNTPRTEPWPEDDAATRIAAAIREIRPAGDALVLVVDETVVIERVERLRYFLATRDAHLTLLVTQTAQALPWRDPAPLVLHIRVGDADAPTPRALLTKGADYHRNPRSAFADAGGLAYLDDLALRADVMTTLDEGDFWVLYGFAP